MKNHRKDGHFAPAATAALPNRARGAQPANANARKHGTYAADAGRIDLRRTVDRRVLATVEALEAALGDRLTPQRALILSNVARWLRDLAKLEAYEDELATIVHRRRRDVLPVTEKRWKLQEAINRAVERLGLDVEPVRGRTLGDLVATYQRRDAEPQDAPEADGEPEGTADA